MTSPTSGYLVMMLYLDCSKTSMCVPLGLSSGLTLFFVVVNGVFVLTCVIVVVLKIVVALLKPKLG
jgi:hypothetical protein